jgi:hypothetical protein
MFSGNYTGTLFVLIACLLTKYYQVIKSTIVRWAGHVARMGERRGAYMVLVLRPERKSPFGRPRSRW